MPPCHQHYGAWSWQIKLRRANMFLFVHIIVIMIAASQVRLCKLRSPCKVIKMVAAQLALGRVPNIDQTAGSSSIHKSMHLAEDDPDHFAVIPGNKFLHYHIARLRSGLDKRTQGDSGAGQRGPAALSCACGAALPN
eukprot:6204900-Pleurochrysis_carterae.AAC.1